MLRAIIPETKYPQKIALFDDTHEYRTTLREEKKSPNLSAFKNNLRRFLDKQTVSNRIQTYNFLFAYHTE